MVAVSVVVGSLMLVSCGSAVTVAAPTRPAVVPSSDCTLPKLPSPKVNGSAFQLGGPAVAALRGGAALASLRLDDGEFTMTPPAPGMSPLMSENRAECAALASFAPNGMLMSDLASGGGVVVGYGIVSVAPELITHAQTPGVLLGQTNQNTKPILLKPASYQHRFAWMVVMKDVEVYSGGPISTRGSPTPTTAPRQPPSYDYLIFLMDARTGTDALLYAEGQTGTAGGSVTVPVERVSVPWTDLRRSPDNFHAEITATVLPCDGYSNPVGVDRYQPDVAVIVQRPVGVQCGARRQVTLPLVPGTVTFDLPARIGHDPLGPQVTDQSSNTHGYTARCPARQGHIECYYQGPGATGGVLRVLSEADNGTTITAKVGSAFPVGPLHDNTHYAALPVASTDTSVLSVLFPDSEVHEFRAWKTGHADLYVPTSACRNPYGDPTCTPPWIVHVIIT